MRKVTSDEQGNQAIKRIDEEARKKFLEVDSRHVVLT